MKGKLNGASQTKKRGFISVLMILLAFVVAGLTLGLYFLFKGHTHLDNSGEVEIVSAANKYTDAQKQQLKNSVAKFLGVDETNVPEEGTTARLKHDIRLEIAANAGEVFEKNDIPAASLDRVAYYLDSIGHYQVPSILSAIEYHDSEDKGEYFHFNVLGLLDIVTDVVNHVQNLRNELHDDLTTKQIINVALDLYGKGFEAREKYDDNFKVASNARMGEIIAELEALKKEFKTKYDAQTGSFFAGINNYEPEVEEGEEAPEVVSMFTELQTLGEGLDEKYADVEHEGSGVGSELLSNRMLGKIAEYIYQNYIDNPQMVHSGVGTLTITDPTVFGEEDVENNTLLKVWCERADFPTEKEAYEQFKQEIAAQDENFPLIYADFLNGFRVNKEGNITSYKGFLEICEEYMTELRDYYITKEKQEAQLLSESVRTAQNFVLKKYGELYNKKLKSVLRNVTNDVLRLADVGLGLTKVLNTTSLKSTIEKIADDKIDFNYDDIAEILREYAVSLEQKKVDGKFMKVSDEFYDVMYDLAYPLNEMYSTLYIAQRYVGDKVSQPLTIVKLATELVNITKDGAGKLENVVNTAYDAYIGLLTTLGRENGPLGPAYDTLTAIIHDVQAAQEAKAAAESAENQEATDPAQDGQNDPAQDPNAQDPNANEGEGQEQTGPHYELIDLIGSSGKLPLMLVDLINGSIGRDGVNLTKDQYIKIISTLGVFMQNGKDIIGSLMNQLKNPAKLPQAILDTFDDIEEYYADMVAWANGEEGKDGTSDMIELATTFMLDVFQEVANMNLDYSTITFKGFIEAALNTTTTTKYSMDPNGDMGDFILTDTDRTLYQIIEDALPGDNKNIVIGEGSAAISYRRGSQEAKEAVATFAAGFINNMVSTMLAEKYGMIVEILANGADIPAEMLDEMTKSTGFGVSEVLKIFLTDYDMTNYEYVASWIQELAAPMLKQLFSMLGKH